MNQQVDDNLEDTMSKYMRLVMHQDKMEDSEV